MVESSPMHIGTISVEQQGGVHIVSLPEGSHLSLRTSTALRMRLQTVADRPSCTALVLDAAGLESMDHTGTSVLVSGLRACRKGEKPFVIDTIGNSGNDLTKILATTGLDKVFHVVSEPNIDHPELDYS